MKLEAHNHMQNICHSRFEESRARGDPLNIQIQNHVITITIRKEESPIHHDHKSQQLN